MAVDPQRAEAGLRELVALYRDAQREVAAQVAEAIRSGEIQRAAYRRAAHQRIVAYLASIGVESDALARNLIENAWREGDSSILRVANPDMLDFTFNVINRDAMEEMQRALSASLLDARATVGRQTFDVFRRAGLQSTMFGLLGASGSTRTVSQDVRRRLEQRGIKAFIDRRGREWSLRSYAQMVARTTTREAVTAAQLSRMADQGIELARVSMSGNPCPICAEWQGKLVSLDGRRDTFDGEEVAALGDLPNGGPPFHPNCRHYWSPESIVFAGRDRGASPLPPSGGGRPSAGPASHLTDWQDRVQPTRGLGTQGVAAVDHALKSIAQVHGPGGIPKMVVQRETRSNYGGWFKRGTHNTAVNPRFPDPEFSLVHELGHVQDFYKFGRGAIGRNEINLYASEAVDGPIAEIVDALLDTDTIRKLVEARKGLPTKNRFRNHANYMLRRREIFARGYAQYIATKTGDKVLLAALRRARSLTTIDGLGQWDDAEFEAVFKLFDKVFNGS